MEQYIIEISNAQKVFGQYTVLKNINVNFEQGKIHGLIGRNGSGKTVLLKAICGFISLTKGTIRVNKQVIGKDVDIPPDMGIIIENPGFLTNYSGYKNLQFLASMRKIVGKEEIKQTLKQVGLNPNDKKWVGKYSLGMKQRLAIAQAIMENPKILLLDEPMNGLDNEAVEYFRNLFLKLRDNGTTIILASHNSEDIESLCDTISKIEEGQLTKIR